MGVPKMRIPKASERVAERSEVMSAVLDILEAVIVTALVGVIVIKVMLWL